MVVLLFLALVVGSLSATSAAAVSFAAPRLITSSAVWAVDARSADVDGDGDVDVVGSSAHDGTLRWYENDSGVSPSFALATHVIATGLDELVYVDVGDVDGDDDIDIVASSALDNRVTLHVNDGRQPPSFTLMNISTDATAARHTSAVLVTWMATGTWTFWRLSLIAWCGSRMSRIDHASLLVLLA